VTAAREARPPDPGWPRYSRRPFPPYRYVAGDTPHPTRDPRGHSRERVSPAPSSFDPARWRDCDDYRYAIDLMNYAYWWECHEALEELWRLAEPEGEARHLLRGLLLAAGAQWKRHLGRWRGARSLARKALLELAECRGIVLGLDVQAVARDLRALEEGSRTRPLLLRLEG
jgi:hypothetical protein